MLDWRGDDVKRQVAENVAKAWSEFCLEVEGESKHELRRNHGVESGTLRRSIHVSEAGYDWSSDHVEPGTGSPERGGVQIKPELSNGVITSEVGSGMNYAMPVHQGHHTFQGFHYMTNGLKKAKTKLDSILAKYKVQR